MRLMNYAKTNWLQDLGGILEPASAEGYFRNRFTLHGRKWLQSLPAEERKNFSILGHHALSVHGINWHSMGGIARSSTAARGKRGRFAKGDVNA